MHWVRDIGIFSGWDGRINSWSRLPLSGKAAWGKKPLSWFIKDEKVRWVNEHEMERNFQPKGSTLCEGLELESVVRSNVVCLWCEATRDPQIFCAFSLYLNPDLLDFLVPTLFPDVGNLFYLLLPLCLQQRKTVIGEIMTSSKMSMWSFY